MDANLLKLLQGDETYKQFLQESFDDKSYANAIIQGRVISESLSKLADGVSLLDEELHSQVVSHHEDLLQQATGIETLEGVLQMMQTRIQSLMSSVERIQHHVTEPYNKIASRTAQLRRLQGACDILRRVIRILALSKRMQSQLQGGTREITKAAQSLSELDYLMQGADLLGIHIVEKDLLLIGNARTEVESQARKMLNQGIESQSQTQVATALQVFYNLGSLQTTVNDAVGKLREELKSAVKNCLDSATLLESQTSSGSSAPGRAAMPTPGNTAAWRAALWTRMEKLMDNIYTTCGQVHHLQKVLAKKRDPVTHVCFMEELTKDGNTSVNMFWKAVTHILTHEFAETAQASTFLKQAFEGEYPKLLRLYNDLWIRLQQYCGMNTAGGPPVIQSLEPAFGLFMGYEEFDVSPQQALKDSLAPFEAAYLSRSLSRLLDPINLVLPVGVQNPPSKEELVSIAKTIGSELSVASVDEGLTITVAKNVAKTIHLFTAKCEQLLSTSAVEEVQGSPTVAMQRNTSIVNSLYHLHEAVTKIVCGLKSPPGVAVDAIQTSLEGVSALINQAIDPLLDDVQRTIEAMLLRMHSEDFARTSLPNDVTDVPDTPCSLYIREIQDFIHHVKTNHLSLYECKELMQERLLSVAGRILTLFVRHVSLLRVIGEGGKLKLAADMAQIEFAVGPLCSKVSDLGKPYKLLRSFRPLLFQTSEHILTNPAVGESLPPSIVLHYLFSRAPSELKYPHEVAGWSLLEYSHWLDQHPSEDERLALIKGTLEAYVQSVRSRGDEEYASIYPIMAQVLQTASS